MLFGREKVGPKLHFFATLMVAIGTLGSAFWILSVNSWMQTPAGYAINDVGQFVPADWWAAIFNPFLPLSPRAYGACGLPYHGARRRRGRRLAPFARHRDAGARKMFAMAMGMILLVAPLQIFAGDMHGLNTLEHQPAKVAAMEGHYESHAGAPLILFGIPDDEAEETRLCHRDSQAGLAHPDTFSGWRSARAEGFPA